MTVPGGLAISAEGDAPIGSLIMGFLVGWLGIRTAVPVPSVAMTCIPILLFLPPIWHYRAEEV